MMGRIEGWDEAKLGYSVGTSRGQSALLGALELEWPFRVALSWRIGVGPLYPDDQPLVVDCPGKGA